MGSILHETLFGYQLNFIEVFEFKHNTRKLSHALLYKNIKVANAIK